MQDNNWRQSDVLRVDERLEEAGAETRDQPSPAGKEAPICDNLPRLLSFTIVAGSNRELRVKKGGSLMGQSDGADGTCVRRIVARGDRGEDIRVLQRALNRRLYRPAIYAIDVPDWKTLSKSLTPELWGYCWTRQARIKFTKKHADLYIWRKPARITKDRALVEDGKFGPKTEAAVIKFQRKAALPDDGIAGPEVWEYLFPYWVVRIIVVRVDNQTTVTQPTPGPVPAAVPVPAPAKRSFVGHRSPRPPWTTSPPNSACSSTSTG
jgi:peptidoglycan hydrolase-like protein with peptidoglycan-binding domain